MLRTQTSVTTRRMKKKKKMMKHHRLFIQPRLFQVQHRDAKLKSLKSWNVEAWTFKFLNFFLSRYFSLEILTFHLQECVIRTLNYIFCYLFLKLLFYVEDWLLLFSLLSFLKSFFFSITMENFLQRIQKMKIYFFCWLNNFIFL